MKVKVAQSCLTLCDPADCTVQGILPRQNIGAGSLSLLQGIFPTLGLNPGLPLQADSLPAEPQGKPKNTGVGSLSLLQWIFLTQESNPGLLHCRQILYRPSMLLLLLSCFSRVRLCATPETAAHQAPPSLGFSRQEHWSGLPFPSPMHECEK